MIQHDETAVVEAVHELEIDGRCAPRLLTAPLQSQSETLGSTCAFFGEMELIGKGLFSRKRVINLPAWQPAVPAAVPEGELPVLASDRLIERTGTKPLVDVLRTKLGFPPEMFDGAVQPVIAAFAEFVQLLPATESHHHAEPGGLFTHTVEVVNLALDLRRGQILPRGAPPEAIGEQAHRWTYAVFVAALLHNVGTPIADLRVVMRKVPAGSEPWSPLAGSMPACGATSYRVEFTERVSRRYELHGKLPVLLFNRFVSESILEWFSADGALVRELFSHLAGDKASDEGVLHELVSRADAESVRRNLLSGSRERIATARRVPLITLASGQTPKVDEGLPRDQPGANASGPETAGATTTATIDEPVEAATEAEEYLEAVEERTRAEAEAATPGSRHAAPMLRSPVQPARIGGAEWLRPFGEGVLEAAMRFMGWVQAGLASGELHFNESGAMIHFVPEGMFLVSPRIFREFAKVHGEDGRGAAKTGDEAQVGKGVQRQLLRAAWHVRADKGVNILTYQVIRGGRTMSQLSGVVIEEPARFVNPVPPANPVLARAAQSPRESS
ncbi:MAG: TraI domain-containing protein [Burkholderiales bacterium]|nr:TraI domain-containing protein [Burkholderiales bacterium]